MITLFAVSCSHQGILSPEKMKIVVWGMVNADAWTLLKVKQDSSLLNKKTNLPLYDQVFRSNHITREQFYESYHYYEAHPDQYKLLFDSVSAYGSRQADRLNDLPVKPLPTIPILKKNL